MIIVSELNKAAGSVTEHYNVANQDFTVSFDGANTLTVIKHVGQRATVHDFNITDFSGGNPGANIDQMGRVYGVMALFIAGALAEKMPGLARELQPRLSKFLQEDAIALGFNPKKTEIILNHFPAIAPATAVPANYDLLNSWYKNKTEVDNNSLLREWAAVDENGQSNYGFGAPARVIGLFQQMQHALESEGDNIPKRTADWCRRLMMFQSNVHCTPSPRVEDAAEALRVFEREKQTPPAFLERYFREERAQQALTAMISLGVQPSAKPKSMTPAVHRAAA